MGRSLKRIFVCLKQVPDTETKIKFQPDSSSPSLLQLDPLGVKWVLNPYDEYALEEAIQIRDKNPGAQVWVVSVGPKKRIVDALRTALATGADEAIAVDAPEILDSSATAQILFQVIQEEIALKGPVDLILMGKMAIDTGASCTPSLLAQMLSIPHVGVVSKLTFNGDFGWVAERDIEGGAKEIFEIEMPCLISANKGLNSPRYASLPGIMKAKKKMIQEKNTPTFVSHLKWLSATFPPEKPPVKMLTGDSTNTVVQLVQLLRDEAKVL